ATDAHGCTGTETYSITTTWAPGLSIVVQPSNVVAGVAIAPGVRAHVADDLGTSLPGAAISLGLVGSGVLAGGGAIASDADGVAGFLGLSVDLAGSKQLTASSGTLASVTSTAFAVSPAAAASLAFTVQPSNVVAGVAVAPAVQIKVADAFGN